MKKGLYVGSMLLVLALAVGLLVPGYQGSVSASNTCLAAGSEAMFDYVTCEESGGQPGGTLVIHSSQNFKDLDPTISNSAYDTYVINAIFDELIMNNPETGVLEPYVAESWETSEDGCTTIFKIREGIEFHDWTDPEGSFHEGEALTAEDVCFTLNRIIDPEVGSPNASELEWMEKCEVIGNYQAKVITKPERCPFCPGLGNETQSILPKDTFEALEEMTGDDEYFNSHPVGSGPFIFQEWRPAEKITLVKNEDYWLKEPCLDGIKYRPIPKLATAMLELEAGGVDIVDNMPAEDVLRFKDMEEVVVQQRPSLSYFYMAFNSSKAPSNDARFRKAVYHSTDFDAAIMAIFGDPATNTPLTGVRAFGAVPPAVWGNDREHLQQNIALGQDLEEAKRLFQELLDEGVIPSYYAPKIYTPPDPRRTRLGEIVATNLKQLGVGSFVNASVQPLEWGAYLDLLYRSEEAPEGEYEVYVIGWSGGYDPHDFLYYMFTTENAVVGSANNFSFYSNPKVDDLIARADTFPACVQSEREALYVEAQRIVMADYVHIPAYHYIETRGVRSRVNDYLVSPTSNMWLVDPFRNVWVEQ